MSENKRGFLLGIIQVGERGLVTNDHIAELHDLLQSNTFKSEEEAFIDRMFDCYIRPVHKSYKGGSSCNTASNVSSRRNSRGDVEFEAKLTHETLKKAVTDRDVVCLFCWTVRSLECATIIANEEQSILQRAGLDNLHQVQNGLLLCKTCQGEFDKLMLYVDVVDDTLVVKVVNKARRDDTTSKEHQEWLDAEETIKNVREGQIRMKSCLACKDGRHAVEANEEMALYFVQNDAANLPNRVALEFHKAACVVWNMAGGVEPVEYYSDDDTVDTAALKRRFKIQDSVESK